MNKGVAQRFHQRAQCQGNTMNNSIKLLAAIIASGATSLASAAAYSCSGSIDFVSVAPTGVVTVSSPSSGLMTFYPCSLTSTVNGVTVDTCKAILSVLMLAKATGAQVGWWFSDSIGCNRASFNGGNWYWLSDPSGNWYYGPQIQ
jgi:hypothetical protein